MNRKVAYRGFLPAAAAVLYTFVGAKGGFARITWGSFVNTDSSTRTFHVGVVPAGETITDHQWDIVSDHSLATNTSKNLLDGLPEGPVLKAGDQLVAFASVASKVAANIVVEEVHQ